MELNMGCYHISLSKHYRNLCTFIITRGKYRYKRLPMGVGNPPGIFQEKLNKMFCGFEFIRSYINDLLIITKDD